MRIRADAAAPAHAESNTAHGRRCEASGSVVSYIRRRRPCARRVRRRALQWARQPAARAARWLRRRSRRCRRRRPAAPAPRTRPAKRHVRTRTGTETKKATAAGGTYRQLQRRLQRRCHGARRRRFVFQRNGGARLALASRLRSRHCHRLLRRLSCGSHRSREQLAHGIGSSGRIATARKPAVHRSLACSTDGVRGSFACACRHRRGRSSLQRGQERWRGGAAQRGIAAGGVAQEQLRVAERCIKLDGRQRR